MTVEKLEKEEQNLEELITKCAKDNGLLTDDLYPIYDGIYSAKKYLKSPIKIMWILKEPYDDLDMSGNPCGGAWSVTKTIFDEPTKNIVGNKTLETVAYICYGIFYNKRWYEMDYISQNEDIANSVQQIAYINISKMPCYTTSSDSAIYRKYKQWKDVLFKQIETYSPDVMIFGNTYKYFENDLCKSYKLISNENKMNVYEYDNNKLIIDAYHPANRIPNYKEAYVDTIIESVLNWMKNKN